VKVLARPTDRGKEYLSELLNDARDRASCSEWGEFAQWISERSGIAVTKDAVYKIAKGRYEIEPPARVLYALTLANTNLLQFRNDGGRMSLQEVYDLLYERRKIDGSLT